MVSIGQTSHHCKRDLHGRENMHPEVRRYLHRPRTVSIHFPVLFFIILSFCLVAVFFFVPSKCIFLCIVIDFHLFAFSILLEAFGAKK